MSDTYSLADMKAALGGNEDGMFGGTGYMGFLILFFLFFLGRNNGIFGGNGAVEAGVVAPVTEAEKVEEPEVVDATPDKNTELAVVSTQKKKTASSKIASALAAIIGTATTAAAV